MKDVYFMFGPDGSFFFDGPKCYKRFAPSFDTGVRRAG